MEHIGGLLILLSMATGTAALIALIRPLPRIYLPTRKWAAIVWAISFLLFGLGGAMLPTPNPEERAAQLIAEIKSAQGTEREVKLKELISIDPDTTEFPQEISSIREREKQERIERKAAQKAEEQRQAEVKNFVSNGVGKKVPFEMWSVFGSPDTLDGTNSRFWVAYQKYVSFQKPSDVSFVKNQGSLPIECTVLS